MYPTLRESLSDELQIEFRQLQKKRMPWLSKDESVDLFQAWRDCYLAGLEAGLAAVRKCMAENERELRKLTAEQHKVELPDKFICKRGEVIADPLDPKMLGLHGPHFIAASLERTHDGLEQRKATISPAWTTGAARQVDGTVQKVFRSASLTASNSWLRTYMPSPSLATLVTNNSTSTGNQSKQRPRRKQCDTAIQTVERF